MTGSSDTVSRGKSGPEGRLNLPLPLPFSLPLPPAFPPFDATLSIGFLAPGPLAGRSWVAPSPRPSVY
eukprot:CAMPEP_0194478240 /NCGR_PEP_ID=MMETSP0253-20130528/1755_1 /TAXON_ID=2966 /ORGANISM="Noctiluca scintillans" /LENGTH=67 /DNA_ID=CAMNT_0039317311 /DNA_START=156 /DNA_END=356 /DNA_ORIENTATION=-